MLACTWAWTAAALEARSVAEPAGMAERMADSAALAVPVGALAVDPNNPDIVYACLGVDDANATSQPGTGILKSIDGGMTWQLMAQPFFSANGCTRISKVVVAKSFPTAANPNPPTKIFVTVASGGPGAGVYLSTDGAQTFTNLLKPSVMLANRTEVFRKKTPSPLTPGSPTPYTPM